MLSHHIVGKDATTVFGESNGEDLLLGGFRATVLKLLEAGPRVAGRRKATSVLDWNVMNIADDGLGIFGRIAGLGAEAIVEDASGGIVLLVVVRRIVNHESPHSSRYIVATFPDEHMHIAGHEAIGQYLERGCGLIGRVLHLIHDSDEGIIVFFFTEDAALLLCAEQNVVRSGSRFNSSCTWHNNRLQIGLSFGNRMQRYNKICIYQNFFVILRGFCIIYKRKMLRRVKKYIRDERLLRAGDRVLVCVSGGADSVALLDVMVRGGYECIVAHCNFQLRGEESERDERFVRSLAEQKGVEVCVTRFDTEDYAKAHQLSIEMAARRLRYRWFDEVARAHDCKAVAVAHHQNDQAETVLMNLRRGAGLRGMVGMRALSTNPETESEIPVIRPLLCTTREYIRHYLRDIRKMAWVEDSSNTDTSIRRNAIRQELAGYTKAEIEHMAETAYRMQGYADMLDGRESRAAGICQLYEKLKDCGSLEVDKIYDAMQQDEGGKRWESETHVVVLRKHTLYIDKK